MTRKWFGVHKVSMILNLEDTRLYMDFDHSWDTEEQSLSELLQ